MGWFAEDIVRWAWQTKHGDGVRVSVGEAADTEGKSLLWAGQWGRGLCLPTSSAALALLVCLLPSGNPPPSFYQ